MHVRLLMMFRFFSSSVASPSKRGFEGADAARLRLVNGEALLASPRGGASLVMRLPCRGLPLHKTVILGTSLRGVCLQPAVRV